MLRVHHLENSRSLRIVWLLEEMGVPYELCLHARDPQTQLAPARLRQIHPLGKAPIVEDGERVLAESGAIIEHLVARHAGDLPPNLTGLQPAHGTPAHQQCRFWMHYAEGSLMNWLLMGLVFKAIPEQPMPWPVRPLVRPLLRAIFQRVDHALVRPNLETALQFMEAHLHKHVWFAGDALSMADFQMGFAVESALSLAQVPHAWPHLQAYVVRMQARPAYQRALRKVGGAAPAIGAFQ